MNNLVITAVVAVNISVVAVNISVVAVNISVVAVNISVVAVNISVAVKHFCCCCQTFLLLLSSTTRWLCYSCCRQRVAVLGYLSIEVVAVCLADLAACFQKDCYITELPH